MTDNQSRNDPVGVERPGRFGDLLREAREAVGVSRAALAERVGLDPSHVYRIEVGGRRPSRASALALAEALGLGQDALDDWVTTAGYAPVPLLATLRGSVRTGGRGRRRGGEPGSQASRNPALWAEWLDAMGLQGALGHLLTAMEHVGTAERQEITSSVSALFTRIIKTLEAPVRTAVIPAAGGQHRLVALHVMQRMLLRVIAEAADAGIANIILVLAPGTSEPLCEPIKQLLRLTGSPFIKIQECEQPRPDGLGDAILQAQPFVGEEPFAVLLPDDIVRERIGRVVRSSELRRMIDAFARTKRAHLLAVTPVATSKMPHCGVARAGTAEGASRLRPVVELAEKPRLSDKICRARPVLGIVGRYVLHPSVFNPLRELRDNARPPIHLTDALERLRQGGHEIYAFELSAKRRDLGEVLAAASELVEDAPES